MTIKGTGFDSLNGLTKMQTKLVTPKSNNSNKIPERQEKSSQSKIKFKSNKLSNKK